MIRFNGQTILKKKTILIINQTRIKSVDNIIAGSGFYEIIQWAKYFQRVIFLCFSDGKQFLYKKLANNLLLIVAPFDLSGSIFKSMENIIKNHFQLLLILKKIIKIFKIDLIRAENLLIAGLPAYIISKITKTPYITWLVGFERKALESKFKKTVLIKILKFFIVILEHIILKNSNFVFAISEELMELTKHRNAQNTILSSNFINLNYFPQKKFQDFDSSKPKKFKLLYIGRLEKEKGIEILMRAINIILKKGINLELNIVGAGSLKKWSVDYCKSNKIQEKVKFLGRFDYFELTKIYQNADIFILPSYTEGMPASLMEAMASGCACISTNVGMVQKLVKDGENGILIEPGNPQILANAIEKLVSDPEKILKYGEEGREIIKKFTKNYIKLHGTIYSKIISMNNK